ncbi:hypothetical protein GOD64_21690 [Sinorhizobium medicae]|nr:hypothetical protein [Sinorhizobium medicae]MDX1072660.1 hypothetical protein [Sinorhizobium medicae]
MILPTQVSSTWRRTRPSPRNGARCRADLDLDKLPPQAGEVDCASARFSEIGYAIVST